jgi:16S rRNA (guanine966-N2)-methyltransferase
VEQPGGSLRRAEATDQKLLCGPSALRENWPMRIIGGVAGGLILKAPKGLEVRPTPDLVRQALFNSLSSRVEGARVLELFGGTGALSLECLSRGARQALCIELSPKHARIIEQNFALTKLPSGSFRVRVQDVFTALPQLAGAGEQFDLIVADPPYGEKNISKRSESFAQRLLDDENLPRALAPDGLFVLGHARRDTLALPGRWHERKFMKHGDSVMRFLELERGIPIPRGK